MYSWDWFQSWACPRCRANGNLAAALYSVAGGFRCTRCDFPYPLVDGIPFVTRDPQSLIEQFPGPLSFPSAAEALDLAGRIASGSGDTAQASELKLLATHAFAHYPHCCPSERLRERLSGNQILVDWLAGALNRHRIPFGPALELGCGPGGFGWLWAGGAERDVILTDIRPASVSFASRLMGGEEAFLPVQQHDGVYSAVPFKRNAPPPAVNLGMMVCDAHDPPFSAGSFALIAALNLLDSTSEPWLLLGQIDALLKPDGICVLALPYQQDACLLETDAWIEGPEHLLACLRGDAGPLDFLSYEIIESADWIPWLLPSNDRLIHEFQGHVLVARKRPHQRSD